MEDDSDNNQRRHNQGDSATGRQDNRQLRLDSQDLASTVSAAVSQTLQAMRDNYPATSHGSYAVKDLRKNDVGFFNPDLAHKNKDGIGLVADGGKGTAFQWYASVLTRIERDITNNGREMQIHTVHDALDPLIRTLMDRRRPDTDAQSLAKEIHEQWSIIRDMAISESDKTFRSRPQRHQNSQARRGFE